MENRDVGASSRGHLDVFLLKEHYEYSALAVFVFKEKKNPSLILLLSPDFMWEDGVLDSGPP